MPRFLPSAGLLSLALLLPSCGAGLITGIATGSRGDSTPAARAPELNLNPVLPLVPPPGATRTIVVANAQLAGVTRLRVRIDAAGTGVDQPSIAASGQGGSTTITFALDTTDIQAAVGDPTVADVPGELRVLIEDRLIGAAVPIVLARQPRATLELDAGTSERLLSPFGQRVSLRVDGLRSTTANDLAVVVSTPDPDGAAGARVQRLATDVSIEPADGGSPIVSATLPGSVFPVQAELRVRDALAGQSTSATNAFYRPEVVLALPSQGPTTGGSLLSLVGNALVPRSYGTGASATQFDFGRIELLFKKGTRTTRLANEDFRAAESSNDRLVFTMPPSPDGRPGRVDIVLRIDLGALTTDVVASSLFLFANPDPFFGPRGTVLERLPVAVAPIALDSVPSTTAAPDFAALTDQGGVAFLQLLLAQQNGMFQRFAAPRQIGNPEVAAERGPRDLCIGDFDGDAVPDVFIVNEGAAAAVHHLVLGQAPPSAPLGAVHSIPAAPGTWKCCAARFDGDARPDVLLIPGPAAPANLQPQVLLARPAVEGRPVFLAAINVPVTSFPYEAFEVADLDGDGALDVALVSGTASTLAVAWGNGDGTFTASAPFVFVLPGYTPDPQSPAVGLHACRDGAQQSLGLVLSGLLSSFGAAGPTQPTVVVLSQTGPRTYGQAGVKTPVPLPTEPIGHSLAADLDAAGPIELVVAMRDEPLVVSLGLLQFQSDRFLPIADSIEGGIVSSAESPRQIRGLAYGRAFPDANAVFLVHETEVDGSRERRLSTRLVQLPGPGQPQPLLLPPDAGGQLTFTVRSLVGGNFSPLSVAAGGRGRDLALVRPANGPLPDAIVLIANDGFGGFPRLGKQLEEPGLLADSLSLVPSSAAIDRLVYATRDSRLSVWRPAPGGAAVQLPDAGTTALRALSTDPLLAVTDLAESTRLRIGDVDGDGIADLVALLSFGLPGEGQAALALMRGKASVVSTEFPFFLPTTLTPVHGNASALVLGDFVANGTGQPRRLEVGLAVPTATNNGGLDGDHVRFYRHLAGASPAEDRLVAAAAAGGPQVLLAGSQPTELAAADFDRDGTIDLLVACRGDSSLRLFRNTMAMDASAVAVDVGAFHEALGSPRLLASGRPTRLSLADVNGDGNPDAVAFVEFTSSVNGLRSTTIASYLSSGSGGFDGPRFVSPTRIGNRNAHLSGDLGDWNRDGVVDLFLGWSTSELADINLRVLFGGTR